MNKYLTCDAVYKEINDSERSITHYISTPDKDRDGECINPFGMIDADFSKAPSVFYNHNYNMPVAKSLWRTASEKGVLAKTKFGSTELAKDIYTLHKEDIIRTWSIGFRIPVSTDAVSWDEKNGILNINRWELIEYSSAPVPSNPNCLDQVKTIGLKSYEMINEIEKLEAFTKINEMLKANSREIEKLSEMYDNFDNKIEKAVKESHEKLLKDSAEAAGRNISSDEIRRMFAGAVSSILGRKPHP